jgi:tRNA A37 threonylcarbamoyladenosine biosynthesis protein TsaE
LGLSEFFQQTIALIEWGKKFNEYFDEYLLISFQYFEHKKDVREITFTCKGNRFNHIISLISKKLPNLLPC